MERNRTSPENLGKRENQGNRENRVSQAKHAKQRNIEGAVAHRDHRIHLADMEVEMEVEMEVDMEVEMTKVLEAVIPDHHVQIACHLVLVLILVLRAEVTVLITRAPRIKDTERIPNTTQTHIHPMDTMTVMSTIPMANTSLAATRVPMDLAVIREAAVIKEAAVIRVPETAVIRVAETAVI